MAFLNLQSQSSQYKQALSQDLCCLFVFLSYVCHLYVSLRALPEAEATVFLTCLSLSATRVADVIGRVLPASYRQPTFVLHRCEQGSTPPPACSKTFRRFCKTIYVSVNLSVGQFNVLM